ncbi:hypothetical protein D9M72_467790 [compost metagenome]
MIWLIAIVARIAIDCAALLASRSFQSLSVTKASAAFWPVPKKEKPLIAMMRSTAGSWPKIFSACSTTSVVRLPVASDGSCIMTITKPWSSSGRNDDGSFMNSQPRPASTAT